MGTQEALRNKVEELGERQWDDSGITARYEKLAKEGIPRKSLNKEECLANKPQILERVQQRAEEYNYILKNCAQGTALALMEEFGLGNMEIIKALTPFPGIGGTGEICGGITGSLITFGLFSVVIICWILNPLVPPLCMPRCLWPFLKMKLDTCIVPTYRN